MGCSHSSLEGSRVSESAHSNDRATIHHSEWNMDIQIEYNKMTKQVVITGGATGFHDHYVLGRELGRGSFSVVREASHKKTGLKYAVKCIKKEDMTEVDVHALSFEVNILIKVTNNSEQAYIRICDFVH